LVAYCNHVIEVQTVPRRLNSHAEARNQILAVANGGLPPAVVATRLMAAVQVAIPCDGYRLFGLDPTTSFINRLLAASDNDGWARLEWLREHYLAGVLKYAEQAFLVRMGLPVIAFQERQERCWGFPQEVLSQLSPRGHRELFDASRGPIGGAIVAHFPAAGRLVAMLQLYRREKDRPFEAADVAFLRRHLRTIGEAIAVSLNRERALRNSTSLDAAGVLVLTRDRKITVMNRTGEMWLSRMIDADLDGHAPLPAAVWSAIAELRSREGQVAGIVTAPTVHGDVRVEATLAGDDGSVSVVLGPLRPPAPPAMPDTWPLTRQEQRILELLLRGSSNRDMATSLSVSENTVEFHLRNVYDKLGVSSRSQLLARYFQEHLFPVFASQGDGPYPATGIGESC
jgi:DNA-binding NarL/FixJ family response regulator